MSFSIRYCESGTYRFWATIAALAYASAAEAGASAEPAGRRAVVACERAHIDVGETSAARQIHKFQIKNISETEVRITATSKSCGCVKREFGSHRLRAGESTEMTLDFPIRVARGVADDFLERLTIFVNDDHATPALVLSVSGRYIPVAYRLRDGIYIEAKGRSAETFKGRIELFLHKGRGVEVTSIETLGSLQLEAVITKREATANEEERRLLLDVSGKLRNGVSLPATATVVVKLNNDDVPEMRIPVVLYRKDARQVRFSPEILAFGVASAGASIKRVVAVELPKGGKYAVEKADAGAAGINVAIEENLRVPHVVKLRCELDASAPGKIERELSVTVVSPEGIAEVYKIPISGFVRAAATAPLITRAPDDLAASVESKQGK